MINTKKHLSGALLLPVILLLVFTGNSLAQGKCLIISDIHFNPFFTNDGKYNLDRSLIKKLTKADADQWKDILEQYGSGKVDGSLRGQDSNYGLLKLALDSMARKIPHPDFIVIAGDFIWHDDPSDPELKLKSIQFIASLFRQKFGDVPVIPALGNNDSDAGDYLKQSSQFIDTFDKAWKLTEHHFDLTRLKTDGYYTFKPANQPNLEFILINSTLVGYSSWVKTTYPAGAKLMLAGLSAELARAKAAGKKVWLIMHIPAGKNGYNDGPMWRDDYSATFTNTIMKYCSDDNSSVIRFMAASHTHLNDFRVVYKKTGGQYTPVSYMQVVPSIGMDHYNNPSFMIAEYDNNTYRITSETNFYLNLYHVEQGWNNQFNLPASLGLKRISAGELSNFLKNVKPESEELNNYSKYFNLEPELDTAKKSHFYQHFTNYLKADSLKQE